MRIGLLCAAVSLCALVGTPAAAQVQERTIRWGHLNNTDHPVSFGVKKFAEVLAAKSGGKLKIREFPASQLGNELQQQSAVRGGTQETEIGGAPQRARFSPGEYMNAGPARLAQHRTGKAAATTC